MNKAKETNKKEMEREETKEMPRLKKEPSHAIFVRKRANQPGGLAYI